MDVEKLVRRQGPLELGNLTDSDSEMKDRKYLWCSMKAIESEVDGNRVTKKRQQ
jgi:hypothetical protein